MPAELLLGHSPPVYNPLLYSPLVVTAPTITSRSVPPRIRPCLSSGSLAIDSIRNSNDGGSNKQKKRVVFADDRGRPLTQVFHLNPYLILTNCKNNQDNNARIAGLTQVFVCIIHPVILDKLIT